MTTQKNLTQSLFVRAKAIYDKSNGKKDFWHNAIKNLLRNKGLQQRQIGGAINNFKKRMATEYNVIIPNIAPTAKTVKYENRWNDENTQNKRALENFLLTLLSGLGITSAFILPSTNPLGEYATYIKHGFTKILGIESKLEVFKKYSKIAPFHYTFGDYTEMIKYLDNSYYFAGDYCGYCVNEMFFANLPKGAKWSYTIGNYDRRKDGIRTTKEKIQAIAKCLGGTAFKMKEISSNDAFTRSEFIVKGIKYYFHCYKDKGLSKPMLVVTNF